MDILKLLSAGGDLATMAFVYAAWRFDKRISLLEWMAGNKTAKQKG